MLRTFLFLGLAVMIGGMLIGFFLGMAGLILSVLIRALIFGLLAYLAIRIISPSTAAKIRHRIEGRPLPPW